MELRERQNPEESLPVPAETATPEAVAQPVTGEGPMTPASVLALQRTVGNAALSHVLGGPVLARDPVATADPAAQPATTGTPISEFSSVQDAKSAVIAELENLTRHQLIALDTLYDTAELKDPPREPSLTEKIIMGLLLMAVDKLLGSVAGHVAEGITEYAAKRGGSLSAELLKAGSDSAKEINEQLKTVLQSGVKGLYGELFPAGKPPSTTPVIAFFDREKKLLSALGADRVTKFTNAAAKYDSMDKDAALLALEMLRKSHRDTALVEGSGSGPTYRETLSGLANLIAELRAGSTTEQEHAAGELDAAKLGASSAGVLHLNVRLDEGNALTIESATMGELNQHLRASFADRPIGDLGINVSARIVNEGHTWLARNTGGTMFVTPRETGQAYHYVTYNVMRRFDDPSEKRRLYASQSLTGAGGWGYIDAKGNRVPYDEIDLWEDEEDEARKADVEAVWDEFRGSTWSGARKLMEEGLFKLSTPSSIGAA